MMHEVKTASQFDAMLEASAIVDFDNVADAIGYATLIFSAANEADILMSNKNIQSPEAIKITQLAKSWVLNIKNRITRMTAGDAMDILEPFDFMYRIANRMAPQQNFIDGYILKAFEARIHGDKSVNEYHLFRFIKNQLDKKNKAFFGRALNWYSASLDRWYKNFRYGSSIEHLSDYDTLEIVSILMSENLFVFTQDQNLFKEKLFKNHLHYLDKINELSDKELAVLSQYLSWSGKFMPYKERSEYELSILRAQIDHPNTNRFYRRTLLKNFEMLS